MTNTLLHKSTSGQWVPCTATVRACPRQHITLNAAGAPVGKEDMLADVVATVKRRNKRKSVPEQLAAVRVARAELSGEEKPYQVAGKELWAEEKRLVTAKWEAAEPRDYMALNDYEGLQELMGDAFYDRAASDYQRAYVRGLDEHLDAQGYQPVWMLPALEVRAPYGLSAEKVEHLAGTLGSWASFILAHRGDASNAKHRGHVDAFERMRAEEEAEDAPYEYVRLNHDPRSDYDDGTRGLRVYADGTATPVVRVGSSDRKADRWGGAVYGADDGFHAARRPLAEVLAEVNKVWYYPAESNPSYREDDAGARYSSWDDDTDSY